MSAREQLDLSFNDTWLDRQCAENGKEEFKTIVDVVGLKQVAFDNDEQPSVVSHAFERDSRHVVKFAWLPYCLRRAPSPRLIALLAAHAGYDITPRRALSAEQKYERLRGVIDKLPDAVRRVLYEDAFGVGAKP